MSMLLSILCLQCRTLSSISRTVVMIWFNPRRLNVPQRVWAPTQDATDLNWSMRNLLLL